MATQTAAAAAATTATAVPALSAPAASTAQASVSNPEAIQAAQEAVALKAVNLLHAALGSIDFSRDPAETASALNRFVAALSHTYGTASAALSAMHYSEARSAAGVITKFTPIPADPAPLAKVGATVGWATAPLRLEEPDIEAAERNLIAGIEKLVLDAGRGTTIDNIQRDKKAHGWYRVTEPAPCAFCALLATRGVVYRSEKTADFKAHDHCRCYASPSFGDYEMPAQVQKWLELYQASKAPGAAKTRRQFRTAFESTLGV